MTFGSKVANSTQQILLSEEEWVASSSPWDCYHHCDNNDRQIHERAIISILSKPN